MEYCGGAGTTRAMTRGEKIGAKFVIRDKKTSGKAVRNTVEEILMSKGGVTQEEASAIVSAWQKAGRYFKDSWK